jgi:hypothetical protein
MSTGKHQDFEQLQLFTEPPASKVELTSATNPLVRDTRPILRLVASSHLYQGSNSNSDQSRTKDFQSIEERLINRTKFF